MNVVLPDFDPNNIEVEEVISRTAENTEIKMNLDALEDLIRIVNDLNVKVDLNLRNPYNGNRYGYKLSALKEENI